MIEERHGHVRVQPSGIELELEPGETLMDAARRSGYRWPTVCGGQGTCRTCYVLVQDGAEHCSSVSAFEAEGIDAIRRPVSGEVRLACQLGVRGGSTTVEKRGVKPMYPS